MLAVLYMHSQSFAQARPTEAQKMHSLFEQDWQWRLQNNPFMATQMGDKRYNNRLPDLSPQGIEKTKAHDRAMLAQIQKIDKSKLRGQDILSYELFLRKQQNNVEGQAFATELMPIDQLDGAHLNLSQSLVFLNFQTLKDYQDYLARLEAYPLYNDQVIQLMQQGMQSGWVQVAVPLQGVPAQIQGQVFSDVQQSILYEPFKKFPDAVPASERARLQQAAQQVLSVRVMPAYQKLHDFVKNEYLPACRTNPAASALPNGKAFYEYSARNFTTTRLTAQEIHNLGLQEVARIRQQMENIIKETGFKGSFNEFLVFLRTDPQFYYTNPEDLLIGYRDICKRIDAELPRLFAELPRLPYGVKPFPDFEAPSQTTARYYSGALDGSRPGYFIANTYKLETRPKYEMEALALHEAMPGHHLQIARAQELQGLPLFRKNSYETAYVEGWGLYAESLGTEMGFYTNPYSRFGQLTYEMWRACRLVVDTGIHALGWTREQAIRHMLENTAKSENDITVEVDRYIAWPGQALAYKIGELKIKEIRAHAQRQLGDRFDIRTFHNALLDDGPLPLEVLENKMNTWIRNAPSAATKR